MKMEIPKREKLLFRLPLYILLPASTFFFVFDHLLLEASGGDEYIYLDTTIRYGMSGGFGIFLLALFLGSFFLLVAVGTLIKRWANNEKFIWQDAAFIPLGVISHPWVLGRLIDFF